MVEWAAGRWQVAETAPERPEPEEEEEEQEAL